MNIFNGFTSSCATERFQKAARDGNLLILKEATKRDLNAADEDGMTAVHWAAYDGRLEALRIITGRGGNPDLPDYQGQTALHHAVRRNHLHCVSFLINFGCNVWALDDDGHSALDLAGILGHDTIVRYLDCELACRLAQDRKTADKSKTKALQEVERRLRKKEQQLEKRLADLDIGNQKSIPIKKNGQFLNPKNGGKTENGGNSNAGAPQKSVRERVIETLRLSKPKKNKQGKQVKCATAPTTTTAATAAAVISRRRCLSMAELPKVSSNDVLFGKPVSAVENDMDKEMIEHTAAKPLGLFDRPGFGSVSFRNLRVVTMFATQSIDIDSNESGVGEHTAPPKPIHIDKQQPPTKTASSILEKALSAEPILTPPPVSQAQKSQSRLYDNEMEEILCKLGLSEYYSVLQREHISSGSLHLVTEKDLMDLGLPLGPRRMILDEIKKRDVQFEV